MSNMSLIKFASLKLHSPGTLVAWSPVSILDTRWPNLTNMSADKRKLIVCIVLILDFYELTESIIVKDKVTLSLLEYSRRWRYYCSELVVWRRQSATLGGETRET